MSAIQSAWQRFLSFITGTSVTSEPEQGRPYDQILAEEIEEKLKSFNPARDVLVVPASAVAHVDDKLKVIGLPDLYNVAKVSVGH